MNAAMTESDLAHALALQAVNAAMASAANRSCHCIDVDFGSYKNTVPMWTPWKREDGKHYCACIDTCLANEIASLWALGIKTANSCCGHKKGGGWILVYEESIQAMRDLGYIQVHQSRPEIFFSAASRPA